jgi:phage shock protein A
MQNQLVEAKKQVAVSIADQKRLEKQRDEQNELAKEWERKAMLAVRAGDDNLAREALRRKGEHETQLLEFAKQSELQKQAVDKLKEQLRTLNDKIEEAKRKKNILIARQKRAEAHKRIQETMSSIGDKSAFETFERLAEAIEHEERKLIAAAEVAEDLSGDQLIKQFQVFEQKADADQQLLALKQKMGLLGAGAPPEAKQLGKGAAEAELVEDDDAGAGR